VSDRPGALAAVGRTPLVRLTRLVDPGMAEVWLKCEWANPTGSYKDRMALAMIEGAEQEGALAPGGTVVEYTGGSTGSSLALVCAVKGYRLRIVTADAFAAEKLRTMAAFGAELEILRSPDGITPDLIPRMAARAQAIVAADGGYATDQFRNRHQVTGYRALGVEVADALDRIDAWVSYVGTAGSFLGVTSVLRDRFPGVLRVAVEPAESAVLSGAPPGTHRIEGGGIGFVPPLLDPPRDIDRVIAVATADAVATARRAAGLEGVWSGPSTGANIAAALTIARELGPGHTVVTVAVDSGLKYLGTVYA
jgi:cysteine synthase A